MMIFSGKSSVMGKLCFLLLIIAPCLLTASAIDNEEAKRILREALEFSLSTPFAARGYFDDARKDARNYSYNGERLADAYPTTHIVNQRHSMRRFEKVSRTVRHVVEPRTHTNWMWFECEDGSVWERSASQTNNWFTETIWDAAEGILEDPHFAEAECTVSDASHEGRVCVRLAFEFKDADRMMVGAPVTRFEVNSIGTSYRKTKDLIHHKVAEEDVRTKWLSRFYYAKVSFLIGKERERPFLYACTFYDSSGAARLSRSFSEVKFNPFFPNKGIFALPENCRMRISETYDQYAFDRLNLTYRFPWWIKYSITRAVYFFVFESLPNWLKNPLHLLLLVLLCCLSFGLYLWRKRKVPRWLLWFRRPWNLVAAAAVIVLAACVVAIPWLHVPQHFFLFLSICGFSSIGIIKWRNWREGRK